ncbi:DUF5677 domain-containing protein [Nesterenkonia ebinurensis]|uniref:DUF5677 domain-containing protein n=1 Tax=Nesterenkonia ebinurensis TaxID=2608252 RepID=UPI00123D14BF|nr:DUF5677 domain-containing protein [Nesterenkonia ebinurensis]
MTESGHTQDGSPQTEAFIFGIPKKEDLDAARLSEFLENLGRDRREPIQAHLADRSEFQERLENYYQDGLEELDLLYLMAIEAASWGHEVIEKALGNDLEETQYLRYYDVQRGLAARCLKTHAEVSWLLRGGHSDGAAARTRTILEIFAVTRTLAEHGSPEGDHPELVERYLVHREVFGFQTISAIKSSGILDDSEKSLSDERVSRVKKQRDLLILEYGKEFSSACGWAAPLFPGQRRIGYGDLIKRVMPELPVFYNITSAPLHAGSDGLHDTLAVREHEAALVAGPTNLGLALPATIASALLVSQLQAVVPHLVRTSSVNEDWGGYFLVALELAAKKVSDRMFEGEERVKEAEEKFQSERRQEDA